MLSSLLALSSASAGAAGRNGAFLALLHGAPAALQIAGSQTASSLARAAAAFGQHHRSFGSAAAVAENQPLPAGETGLKSSEILFEGVDAAMTPTAVVARLNSFIVGQVRAKPHLQRGWM
jgi:hypothetical protein